LGNTYLRTEKGPIVDYGLLCSKRSFSLAYAGHGFNLIKLKGIYLDAYLGMFMELGA